MTDDVKSMINTFSQREATSHMNTIRADINNALTIIRSQTSDPAEIKEMLQQAFVDIQRRRAPLIAQNATNRIFALSQYEADTQFLTRTGLINKAYKQLYSSTGDPCPICSYIIAETNTSPIPFKQAFVSLGSIIETDGVKQDFDFEEILAGNVHPNCRCYYKITIQEDTQNAAEKEAEDLEKQTATINEIVSSQLTPILEKLTEDKSASDATMKTLSEMSNRLDEQSAILEGKLDQLDKRTKEARQLKEELVEANQIKTKLAETEEYAKQLESLLDA
jgi:DNA repair exonuclease SbcCD ATPase subunit